MVQNDPWGKPYKMVLGKLRGPSATSKMELQTLEDIVCSLFPADTPLTPGPTDLPRTDIPPFSDKEMDRAVKRIRSSNMAPGPDGIPNKILGILHDTNRTILREMFNECLERGESPDLFKSSRLVLLLKNGKPPETPSSYRPLCLLNDTGKLFETLLVDRLEQHVMARGGLSDSQYGFRKGKSTIDAVKQLETSALEAVNAYETVVAVSLDIKNALNSLGWKHIMAALEDLETPAYLLRLFKEYFTNRFTEVAHPSAPEGSKIFPVCCGVPQGSVVGPMLWNITYNAVLSTELPPRTSIIGFADDTLVLARGKISLEAGAQVNDALQIIATKIRGLGLSLAVNKTEAILFCRQYSMPTPNVVLNGEAIEVKKSIKYLGIAVDKDLMYREHIHTTAKKGQCIKTSLSRLMPNIGGPKEPRRRLLASVVHSVLLYGAPIWSNTLIYSKLCLEAMKKVQRRAALRKVCAYRTVSHDAINVLASMPPIDLLAMDRKINYERKKGTPTGREVATPPTSRTMCEWKGRFAEGSKGQWTRDLIPDLDSWVSRKHGHMDYHLPKYFLATGASANTC